MLDNIEKLACLYVYSHARYHSRKDLNIDGRYGDIIELIDDYDHLYMHDGYDWRDIICDVTDCNECEYSDYLLIWTINPDTGFFIFSDYWEKNVCIETEHRVSFNHKPYLNELLDNISCVVKNGHYMVSSWTAIKGFKCTIIGENIDETEVTDGPPDRIIEAFKSKLQNSNLLRGSCLEPDEYCDNPDGPYQETKSPLIMYIFLNLRTDDS